MKTEIICIQPAGDLNFFRLVEDRGSHWLGIWDGKKEVTSIHKTTACTSWIEEYYTVK